MDQPPVYHSHFLGNNTNNYAELDAILGLSLIHHGSSNETLHLFFMDSQLAIDLVMGWKISKAHMHSLTISRMRSSLLWRGFMLKYIFSGFRVTLALVGMKIYIYIYIYIRYIGVCIMSMCMGMYVL